MLRTSLSHDFAIVSQSAPLHEHRPSGAQAAVQYTRGGLRPRAQRRVHDYIVANLDHKITNEALAQIAGLSTCHFAPCVQAGGPAIAHRAVPETFAMVDGRW
jgi:hypothetical protein